MQTTFCVQLRNVVKTYPGTRALDDVSLNIRPGVIHGIIGENGAGKSTLMGVLSGAVPPSAGRILVHDKEIVFDRLAAAVQAGISLVSQEGSLVPDFDAKENICLGFEPVKVGVLVDRAKSFDVASALLSKWFPHASIDLNRPVKELSHADQKVVEILRALHSNPTVLILDEPTATLGAKEKQDLWKMMEQLCSHGVAVLLISHFLGEIVALSHDITALQDGRVVRSMLNKDLSEADLVSMMLNRPGKVWAGPGAGRVRDARQLADAVPVIEATGWTSESFSVDHFVAAKGDVIGLMGLTGAGHFEFARSLFEPRLAKTGALVLDGKSCGAFRARQMMDAGVAFVPDQRMSNALIGDWSVRESISVVDLAKTALRWIGLVQSRAETAGAQRIVKQLSVKTSSLDQKISTLSGGNKQKVSIGRWLYWNERPIRLFVFVEPTEGVDIGAKQEIHDLMSSLALKGAVVVVASSDLVELGAISDRVVPFVKGVACRPLARHEFGEEQFINAIAGDAQ